MDVIDEGDEYCIIKLLPFLTKLQYLQRSLQPNNRVIIYKAIFSDLTDELLANTKLSSTGKFNTK